MKKYTLNTPLGELVATGDDEALYRLDFVDMHEPNDVAQGKTKSIISIEKELKDYFAGKLKAFKTPLVLRGTPFQKQVWQALIDIPYGQTISYLQLAKAVGRDKAYRACGTANGANPLCIIIPCHRVINANGELGGYSSGLERKKWLLKHEKTS